MSIVLSFHSKEVTVELDELIMSSMLGKQEKLLVNKMWAEEFLGAEAGRHHVPPLFPMCNS